MSDDAWYGELKYVFAEAFGELENGRLLDTFYDPLQEVIGREPKIDLIHSVQVGGETGFFFVSGDSAYLVRFEPPNTTKVRAFGYDLTGGTYNERIHIGDTAVEIEMYYEHRRLGRGKTLHARSTRPFLTRGQMSDQTGRAVDRGQKLRETFRRWSMPK
jgi:hypothetical protein